MKIKYLLLALVLGLSPVQAREKIPAKLKYSEGQKTLNLSSSSIYSYEDAMNKFSLMKPEGYVIESIQYFKQGRNLVVAVKLRKSS